MAAPRALSQARHERRCGAIGAETTFQLNRPELLSYVARTAAVWLDEIMCFLGNVGSVTNYFSRKRIRRGLHPASQSGCSGDFRMNDAQTPARLQQKRCYYEKR